MANEPLQQFQPPALGPGVRAAVGAVVSSLTVTVWGGFECPLASVALKVTVVTPWFEMLKIAGLVATVVGGMTWAPVAL